MGKYDDIIDLPHPVSPTRPRMPMANRAAQFSPFAALTGFGEAIDETARLTDRRIELSEAEKEALGRALAELRPGDVVEITSFIPDDRKDGGRYAALTAAVRRVLPEQGALLLEDGRRLALDDILTLDPVKNSDQ